MTRSVYSIECYNCNYYYSSTIPIDTTSLPLTPEILESYIPFDRKTTLTADNQTSYYFHLDIGYLYPPKFGVYARIWAGGSSNTLDDWGNGEGDGDAQITLEFMTEAITRDPVTSTFPLGSSEIRHHIFCKTNKCNTVENILTVIRAATVQFNFDRIISQLAVYYPSGEFPVISCLTYSNFSKSRCIKCRENSSTCIQCQAQTCDESIVCGGCFLTSGGNDPSRLAELNHEQIYLLKSRRSLTQFQYRCGVPNCNTLEKQSEIKSSYIFKLDTKFLDENLPTSVLLSTTTTIDSSTVSSEHDKNCGNRHDRYGNRLMNLAHKLCMLVAIAALIVYGK